MKLRTRTSSRSSFSDLFLERLEARMLMSAYGVSAISAAGAVKPQVVLALIDETLPDQQLLSQSMPGVYQLRYDPHHESAKEVLHDAITAANTLGGKLASLLIFSHGAAGEFALGDQSISAATLR